MSVSATTVRRQRAIVLLGAVFTFAVATLVGASTSAAQDSATTTVASDGATTTTTTAATGASDEQLVLGAEVFAASCSTCHQPGGVGVVGQYPPLKGNLRVQDGAYLRATILNGRKGKLEVDGTTYDNVMPAVAGLGDEDLDAVIAFVQSGFATPKGSAAPADPADKLADGALSGSVNLITTLALLVGLGVGVLVLFPRIAAAHDRLEVTWLDAWMKTGVVVVGIVVLVLIIPNWVVKMSWFADLNGIVQDLLATAIWGAGLTAALWSLWYAHRRDWI